MTIPSPCRLLWPVAVLANLTERHMGSYRSCQGPLSLGTRLLQLGKALSSQMFCSNGWNIKTVCWCHPALQLEFELGLLGHDQRKQMFDQTSENICFVLLVWM